MNEFTIVLPIRGTELEIPMIKRAIRSCMPLKPGEIIIGVDGDVSRIIINHVRKIFSENKYGDFRIIYVSKSKEWGFQLANVIWRCYKAAKYDKIFSFDVDSTLRLSVLMGYNKIGTNNIACISFTKRMPINSPQKLIRYLSHRLRIRSTDYCFTGCYWIWRPYYFEYILKDDYKKIKNGVDGILVDRLLAHPIYKLVTNKEIGARCYTIGNEDYDWRQFQNGIWFWANKQKFVIKRRKVLEQRKNKLFHGTGSKLLTKLHYVASISFFNIVEKNYLIFMFGQILMYQYWYLLKGYRWAGKNPNEEIVKVAATHDLYEFSYLGVKLLPKRKWKDADKTGFNQ